MQESPTLKFVKKLLENLPTDWLNLTTHRLDIYNEQQAKKAFLTSLEKLYEEDNAENQSLSELPTAYDYIRLGHPLSSVLEWTIAKANDLPADHVISFSSRTMPIMAILRRNLLSGKRTRILHDGGLPNSFDNSLIGSVYGYDFEVEKLDGAQKVPSFDGSTILLNSSGNNPKLLSGNLFPSEIDFYLHCDSHYGSILIANAKEHAYINEIQHVRRRESIAMTPANCHLLLQELTGQVTQKRETTFSRNKAAVLQTIQEIAASKVPALLGSSGLSVQYAIMMGLIEHAQSNHPEKAIKFLIPPNCYGGTNDQARRVAACLDQVEILDLPVDREHNMVDSIESVLDQVATEDAIPYIIVEIPTNPRVEVPVVKDLQKVLKKDRRTAQGMPAIEPVFIIDQTFCPNVPFLRKDGAFPGIQTIIYVSGSKFPSGGKCTAGYCTANEEASGFMPAIDKHLQICDNEATHLQTSILAEQMPSMIQRIEDAYRNTRDFVDFIKKELPAAKINFVSEELAAEGFTPSVFSLDLPTEGETHKEREEYKRALNHKLIKMMIDDIPAESRYCVSYGQLKGCYWTIPATSTQGTTKEEDKDYIARVALSPNLDLDRHKEVFQRFVETL